MKGKIVLIDGHSILNRAFYGIPDLTNSEGLHTNGVYGFLNIMLKILDEEQPEYLTVAFDVKRPTFRHEMYPEYKGTRKGMPEELKEQVPLIQEVLRSMGVRIVMKEGYEADDILGTIAVQAQKQGLTVSLVSGDRDLLQLATDKILIRIPKTRRGGTQIEDYHAQEVVEKYGVTPSQIIDLKGLMGDTADNIPGVAGIGEKTAVKILSSFPTVEEAYEHLEEVTPKRTHDLLEKGREQAFLSKKLATIKTDCVLEYSLEEALLPDLFNEQSFAMIKRLEFKSLLKRFDVSQCATASKTVQIEQLTTQKEWDNFFGQMYQRGIRTAGVGLLGDDWRSEGAKKKKAASHSGGQMTLVFDQDSLDLSLGEETTGSKEYPFYGMSVSYEWDGAVVTCCAFPENDLTAEKMVAEVRHLVEQMEHVAFPDWKNALHMTTPLETLEEGKESATQEGFPMKDLGSRQKTFQKVADLSVGAYLLNPIKDTYQVEDLARDYLGMMISSYQELFGKVTMQELVESGEKKEQLLQYLANLSYVSCLSFGVIQKELEKQGMWQLFCDIEIPTAYYLYEMERLGVRADKKALTEMSQKLDTKIVQLEQEIHELAGEEFNINSPKQLGVILFEKMKLPFAKKTKTGYSTSADVLEKLRTEDPIIPLILEYRQVSKLKSTYADGLPVYIEKDNRIHGKFNQTITATGRISSTEPNLQNIPIRMELGRELRKVFIPREGWLFLDADYSQIELRVLAHLSGDPELIDAYRQNQDIHRSTASKVFGVPFEEVTDLQRRNAKAVNFGIVYGISSFGLSQDLGVSRKEAQNFIEQYFQTYPAIKTYLDDLVAKAKETGVACTMFGRRRPVPELSSSNHMQRSFGERIAMNSPIQGTAADIIKIAMIRVSRRLLEEGCRARVVLQVHDELLVETPVEEHSQVAEILQEEMAKAADLAVPLVVEVEQGTSWYEAH
jgi:DNA polymerase-1